MGRTKAEFRAERETVGMTQSVLAKRLGVEERSVRRWESPDAPQVPPQDAWDVLDAALGDQRSLIDVALHEVEMVCPTSWRLVYWSSQNQWDRYHVGPAKLDWRMANATSRLIAALMDERGVRVEWVSEPTARQ